MDQNGKLVSVKKLCFLAFLTKIWNITIRALLAPRNTLLFDTIFTQGQKVTYTNLQELEENAQKGAFLLVSEKISLKKNVPKIHFLGQK